MRWILTVLLAEIISNLAAAESIILATTTSTQDSGLLDVLVPRFTKATEIDVKVIAVGSGAALRMAEKGDADAVLVHAPSAEKPLVESGHLVGGRLVMHNDFIIVGPVDDPAGIKVQRDLRTAMSELAGTGTFISRGDDSGTHKKELELWRSAQIDPTTIAKREETGQGMGETLSVADQRKAYTLTDRGTWLALKKSLQLTEVFEGDAVLFNIYHAYAVSAQKHPKAKEREALRFVEFLVAPETQKLIADFKKSEYGQSLFEPDAGKADAMSASPAP
jgi:tungstate transport system substrate-binding protein